MDYVIFNMDTDTGYTSGYDNNMFNPYDEHGLRLFVQLVLFTELSQLEVKLMKPNTSLGTKREGKYKNESRSNIILVDSTWNKIIVNTTGFEVSGHLRLQMVGKGRKTPDLVYISPYRKNGYIRRAKRDCHIEYEEVT